MATNVLIDNSAFAGVMRLYRPDREMHRIFLKNYPDHRAIDERSFADFLTCLCTYDTICLESSSGWNEEELKREGYKSDRPSDKSGDSWAEQLVRMLPKEIGPIINNIQYSFKENISETDSSQKAFDILCSRLKSQLKLTPEEEIPKVYYASDYFYRKRFDLLNSKNGYPLSTKELACAMFLQRGLYLQSQAHTIGCVYIPYFSRAKLLSQLPPMIWASVTKSTEVKVRLPLAEGHRPHESEYMTSLNEFYYSILQAATWTTYDTNIPFVGAAILSRAGGDPLGAFEIAMEYRQKGDLRAGFKEIDTAIRRGDRPKFERLLEEYRLDLTKAARAVGVRDGDQSQNSFYRLLTCWMPSSVQKAIDALVELLPASARDWGYQASSTLITKTPMQMLFIDHVSSIRTA